MLASNTRAAFVKAAAQRKEKAELKVDLTGFNKSTQVLMDVYIKH
jgi:hypothetical protein